MPLGLHEIRRYARQLALPEVGTTGMERLRAARVVVVAGDLAGETARLYLAGAGVGDVAEVARPRDLAGWRAALAGADAAVHFALDDDGALSAAEAAGVPLLVGRVSADTVELISFRRHRGCGHAAPAVTSGPPAASDHAPGAAAVLLGTLAASEVLFMLLGSRPEAAQLLRLPLAGGEPVRAELPWPRPCPVCGSACASASLSKEKLS